MGKEAKKDKIDQIVKERQEKAHQFAVDLNEVLKDPDKLKPYCDAFVARLKAEVTAGNKRTRSDARLIAGIVLQDKTNEEVVDVVLGAYDLRFGDVGGRRTDDAPDNLAAAVARERGIDLS